MESFNTLVLSLPTRNSTLRMRLWRALKESGCGVLRDGVYVLPATADRSALAKLEADIRAHGGFAMTAELKPGSETQAADVRKLFDRSAEYGDLVQRITAVKKTLPQLGARRGQTAVRRLERSLDKIARIDFLPGPAKAQAADSLSALKTAYQETFAPSEPRSSKRGLRQLDRARYQKRTWATRKTPWVDRLASAWLIKRFIDREARFLWIARPSECPKTAIGFDFDGADFTHVKNRVTFEVLAASFGLDKDPALASISAAVHFLDIGGIPAPDAKGLETMLKGAREKARSDDALLAEAMRVFDLLYGGLTDART
jgi:hypothetical protein